MIKMFGRGHVSAWRPYEEGTGGAHMRASKVESDNIHVMDQTVLMQHKDGFWEVYSLSNCSVIWLDKPNVYMVDVASGREVELPISGSAHTIADEMKVNRTRFTPMQSTNERIDK